MKSHHRPMRLLASITLASIIFQAFPASTIAATNQTLGTVSITHIEQQGNDVAVAFQPLPEGLTVTARVDSEGQGDYLTIQSALADTKTGVIAISTGRYNEHDLVIPAGVILKGGYDSRTWQPASNGQTTLFGLPGKTSIVLDNGSGIQDLLLEQAGTAIRAANGASSINRVVVLEATQSLAMSPFSYVRIANSDFVNNKVVVQANQTNKVFVYNSIFQDNDVILSNDIGSSSFIKTSLFFPNKSTLRNILDQQNEVVATKPLPNAGWQFPDENAGTRVNQNFSFDGVVDDAAKTVPGPTLESTTPINALYLYYQINPGDVLKLVDRDDFSRVVLETEKKGGNFRGWVPVPSTHKIALLLYTNGDQSLPLQIGIDATAQIPTSSYETATSDSIQGITGRSGEANFFYRAQANANTNDSISIAQKEKLAGIEKALILAGSDWLTGKEINSTNLYTLTHSKGFITQVLTSNGNTLASQNYDQRSKKAANEDRQTALMSDYLNFDQVFGFDEDCTLLTTCPFSAEGLQKFKPWKQISLQDTDPALIDMVGLQNQDGWNNGTNTNAHLKIDLSEPIAKGSLVWSQQIIATPATTAHLISFTSNDTAESRDNRISILMNPDGNLQVVSWDQNGIKANTTTNGVSFNPGRKYQLILSFDGTQATLSRDDGLVLWHQDHFAWQGVRFIEAGKSPLATVEKQVQQTLGNIGVWLDGNSQRKINSSAGTSIESALTENEHSLQGSIAFQVASFCQNNSLTFKNNDTLIATISGNVSGSDCNLSLSSSLTSTAQQLVPLTKLTNQPLQFIWQTNTFSGLTTFSLISQTDEIISTLGSFGSKPIEQSVLIDHAKLELADTSASIQLQYLLEPQVTLQNLTQLVPVQRYELLYDTVEANVRNGQATIVPITVEELRKIPSPEKIIPGLEPNKRYFFAARAVLDDGGTSQTTAITDWQVHADGTINNLQANSVNQSTLVSTLALGEQLNYQTAYADQTISESTNTSITGNIIQNHLGDPITLQGPGGVQAWTLGKDIDSSSKEQPQHIYTFPGEYIISSLRTLLDGTVIKQIGFVSITAQPHDYPRISAETWLTKNNAPNWVSKDASEKVPAVIGVNEPLYLLGQAVDVSGRADNAFTWTYEVNWGDGTKTENDEAKPAFNKTHRVNGTAEEMPIKHIYSRPGIYTIVSQVKDADGKIGVFENTVLVTMPEVYPNRVSGVAGSSRLVTISGGVAPYNVTLPDNTEVTLAKPGVIAVSITDGSSLLITDQAGNTTTTAIEADDTPVNDVYLPKDHKLVVEPQTAKARDSIDVKSQGEEHLMRQTASHVYYFGDTLPEYLGDSLPTLKNVVTYTNENTISSDPFQTMGNFGAVLSTIDDNGKEQKKYFSLQVKEARFTGQSQAGIVTGSISPSFQSIPDSIEIWKRGSQDIKLASVTPNAAGRFIYFLPKTISDSGFVSFRLKDGSGAYTDLSDPQGYTTKNQPQTLAGLLEGGNNNVFFDQNKPLATNVEKPTFFGKVKDSNEKYTLTIASENPTNYPISSDKDGAWIVASNKTLEEGKHQFTVKNSQGEQESQYSFTVDRTAPTSPKVITASWTNIQGVTEPFAFVGIKAIGQKSSDYFIQATSEGKFSLSPSNWTNQYIVAVADQAGNISTINTIQEKDWINASGITLWQKLRPYLIWSFLIALAATSIGYARRIKT